MTGQLVSGQRAGTPHQSQLADSIVYNSVGQTSAIHIYLFVLTSQLLTKYIGRWSKLALKRQDAIVRMKILIFHDDREGGGGGHVPVLIWKSCRQI